MKSHKRDVVWERWFAALLAVAVIIAWELAAAQGWLSNLFFPAPSAIIRTFVELSATGELLSHLGASLSRIALGLGLGGVPGLLLGLGMGWSIRLKRAVDPIIAVFHPIPKISVLPLIMIIFGIGEASRVVVVAIAAFFPMLINSMAGVRQINPIHFEVAQNYGASRLQVLARVVIPGGLPFVLSGLRLAFNSALLLTIAAELVTAREGLGALIWFAWETLRTQELYAGLIAISALGLGFNILLQRITFRIVPWQQEA
jgi:NitT/TauT family transport system permease protein